ANSGAENLLGKGDLLLRAGNEVVRLQAPLVDSPICSELQTRALKTANSNILKPHYLQLG
ncbi:MAG: hypothetical protein NW224_29425, partial [Leptolyngbyaceae cyanobacterium bins.302]|nr:hypothetical protein [Leptolyngbyaceae cyanobacterium bins.302]